MEGYAISWQVVLALVVIVGLIVAIVKPILKLNTSLVTFDLSIKALNKSVDLLVKQFKKNDEDHEDIFDTLDEHEGILIEHEKSITDLRMKMEK